MGDEAELPKTDGLSEPRSRRMGLHAPLIDLKLERLGDDFSTIIPSPSSPSDPHTPQTPPVPARSPLRPPAKSVASFTTLIEHYTRRDTTVQEEIDPMPLHSIPSLSTLLDAYTLNLPIVASPLDDEHWDGATITQKEKRLPSLPPNDSAIDLSLMDGSSPSPSFSSSFSSSATLVHPMSKRDHAMHELLSSERAYASDLAFVRDVHLPLALGQHIDFPIAPLVTPRSSGSSSRTPSTGSDSSSSSFTTNSPMTKEDVKVIFGNIAELALFSDNLSERIEEALGTVLEGGEGEDHVGRLFLEVIPTMEPLYKTYITRHPTALAHLNSLPQTPALAAYLAQAKQLATSLTHAWDLPSLLIKPVQRLLKYSLLLTTIIEETPEGHGDKASLRKARDQMEEVAREVNEGRRRLEVVREVLTGKSDTPNGKKKSLHVKSPVINLGRMKSLKIIRSKEEASEDLETINRGEQRLKDCDAFARSFARSVSKWAKAVRTSLEQLQTWSLEFGKVLGLSKDKPSDSFIAFVEVILKELLPLCTALDEMINKDLFPKLARVLKTASAPMRLLQALHKLEPLHESLLNTNYAKSRPPNTLFEASQSYIALKAQLNAELPKYLELLDNGILACVGFFICRQASFWGQVRECWRGLWDALRMDGEEDLSTDETINTYKTRFDEVNLLISGMTMLNYERSQRTVLAQSIATATSLGSPFYQIPPLPGSSTASLATSTSSKNRSMASLDVTSMKSSESYLNLDGRRISHSKSKSSVSEELGHRRARSNTSPPGSSQNNPRRDNSEPRRGRQEHHFTEYDGQSPRSHSLKRRVSETLRPQLGRSSSQRSAPSSSHSSTPPPIPHSLRSNSATVNISQKSPAKYRVKVVHPCIPPEGAEYLSLPFFELRINDTYQVISEAGHPSAHDNIPLYVDEGEDCLLIVRNHDGDLGWALASFTVII